MKSFVYGSSVAQLGTCGRFLPQSPALFLSEASALPFAMEIARVIAFMSMTSEFS